MEQIIILGLILLIIAGAIWILNMIRVMRHKKRVGINWRSEPKKVSVRFFSILVISVIITLGSLYWFIDCYLLDDAPYSFSLENAIENYRDVGGYRGNYKLIGRVDPEFKSEPLIFIHDDEDDLFVCDIRTRKMLIGLERYYISGGISLVDGEKRFDYLIDENNVNGGTIQVFSNTWFGIIYPDKRDSIRINGNIPYFHDIYFNGADYVFWYIEKKAEKAVLSFE